MSAIADAYTVGKAAELLGVSTSALKRWERQEKIPPNGWQGLPAIESIHEKTSITYERLCS